MRRGFRDATGSYGLVGMTLTGVFFADRPVDKNEGATSSEVVIVVDVPGGLAIGDFELIEELKGYREWCIPAAIVNQWPRRLG
jgi:hypothetical protein